MRKIIQYSLFVVYLFLISVPAGAEKFNTQQRYLYIQPGQTVFNIVKVLYPGRSAEWPGIIKQIVRKNPHAFIGADASRIQVGARIAIPTSIGKLKSVSKTVIYKAPKAVGQVVTIRGVSFVFAKNKRKRDLKVGSELYVGDRIFTGAKAFLRLNMIDDAKIDLRCNSEMVIEDYKLSNDGNRSVLNLIKGSLNKVTGSIGKLAEDVYEMKTPMATVGVRGTEYALRVLQSYGCDGSIDVNSRGMFVRVKQGGIDVKAKSKNQKVALNRGETAHLASQDARLKKIEAKSSVFGDVDRKKNYFFGSVSWFILLLPLMLLFRSGSKHKSCR